MQALWRISMRVFAGFFIWFYVFISAVLPGVAFAQTAPVAPHPILCPQGSVANAQGQCVKVNSVPPTCFITVTPSSINVGGSVTVKWQSTNATAGAITNIGNVSPAGQINLLPSSAARTTYFGAFTGPGGTTNCQGSVAVNSGSSGAITGSTDGTNGVQNATIQNPGTVSTPTAGTGGSHNTSANPAVSGLIPCGYGSFSTSNTAGSATGCQACDLATLVQNLINFAIGIAIPIAAALFAWAGILMFTAADNPGKVTQAKQIFKNAFIGFMIAITAWLVINTLLHVIFNQGTFANGNWFTISCVSDSSRPVNNNINQVLGSLSILNGGSPNNNGNITANGSPGITSASSGGTLDSSSGGTSCNAGFTYDADSGTCYNPTTDTIQYPSGSLSNGPGGSCPAGFQYDQNEGDTPTCYNPTTDQVQEPVQAGQQCAPGSTYYPANASEGTFATCYNPDTDTVSDPVNSAGTTSGKRGVAQCADSNDNCSISQLQAQGLNDTQAQAMSCIAVTENAGNSVGNSGTGASGTFQITGQNWVHYAPRECQPSNFGNNLQAAQNNAQCNIVTASNMVQDQGYQPWTGICNTPSGCGNVSYGQAWNPAARTCVSNYDPTNLH